MFRADTDDLILYRRGADLIYRPANITGAFRHGIELTAKYDLEMGMSVDLEYIHQDSENRDTRKALAYTPCNKFKTTLKYVLASRKTRLEATFRYDGERYSDGESRESMKLDDHASLDLKLLQPFTIGKTACEGYFNVDNLFDRDFQAHYGYPDDGIRFNAGLNLTF